MVCKHVCELGRVLTAATPRLEERFDADLKEDRILQAQHGGSQKLSFTRRHKVYRVPVTCISQNPNIPLFPNISPPKKYLYTYPTSSSSPLTGAENYPPQVRVKGTILNNRHPRSPTGFLFPSPCSLKTKTALQEEERECIAWLVTEVFHPSARCPLASPQNPSSPFQQRKIQKDEGSNCVRTFAPDMRENSSRTVQD